MRMPVHLEAWCPESPSAHHPRQWESAGGPDMGHWGGGVRSMCRLDQLCAPGQVPAGDTGWPRPHASLTPRGTGPLLAVVAHRSPVCVHPCVRVCVCTQLVAGLARRGRGHPPPSRPMLCGPEQELRSGRRQGCARVNGSHLFRGLGSGSRPGSVVLRARHRVSEGASPSQRTECPLGRTAGAHGEGLLQGA